MLMWYLFIMLLLCRCSLWNKSAVWYSTSHFQLNFQRNVDVLIYQCLCSRSPHTLHPHKKWDNQGWKEVQVTPPMYPCRYDSRMTYLSAITLCQNFELQALSKHTNHKVRKASSIRHHNNTTTNVSYLPYAQERNEEINCAGLGCIPATALMASRCLPSCI